MGKQGEFLVRELGENEKHRSEKGYRYLASGRINGKRMRRYFRDREKGKADAWVEEMNTKAANVGKRTASILTDDEFLQEAAKVKRQLEPWGRTLSEAAAYFIAHLEQTEKSISIGTLRDEFIDSKTRGRKNKSDRYLDDLKGKLSKFVDGYEKAQGKEVVLVEGYAERIASEVTTDELQDWLESLPVASLVTIQGYYRILRGMFRFAEKKKYIAHCPLRDMDASALEPDEEQPEILTIPQVIALLNNASDIALPGIVIGLYCGIRTSEVQRLDWSRVNLKRKLITLRAQDTKIGKPRHVEIPDNAVEWLKPHAKAFGEIRPAYTAAGGRAYRKEMERLAVLLGLKKWSNHLRHSYGSYHYAAYQDIAKTAAQLGHQNPQITWKHYYQLADPDDAAMFWQIKPGEQNEKIIAI